MTAPDFLVIGHAAQDMQEDGAWKLGGAVSFAATLARNLGLRAAVLTSASPDVDFGRLLPGIDCRVIPTETSTRFHNTYEGGVRSQTVSGRAAPIKPDHVPNEWSEAPIVLLGPLVGEIDERIAALFPESIVGVGAQGWLREIAPDGAVRPVSAHRWDWSPLLKHAAALFASDEDVPPDDADAAIRAWLRFVPIVAFTHGDRGADVYVGRSSRSALRRAPSTAGKQTDGEGESDRGAVVRHIAAFPARVIDLTGAGDIFAAAFLISLKETGDVWQAARFAACAASFVVEGEGLSGVPDRANIEARLREHPDIVAEPSPSPSDEEGAGG